ncbi:MAG: hypothetical protein COU29_03785 [Candidatus Magasanikbacteria bacterium CG10_big_fil_rev_8_21_14_0_10_36_32]|uniref:Polysaccharide chain length determinant N-terminal domain-containing protein n=1 Tax=Candidatus Magasanikbacteria bacterium CG10_big_fil_rev_8_21_14_0_10_36_32 TaxID=1974646 RepID=A0A2M6W5V4_9BACT|nr:MAG: hypothetical protein COU29_03785 [Candidatus Magasanikbacteria bacterium CG10_big_fil_rev_8_21_14_0_10_36_32]
MWSVILKKYKIIVLFCVAGGMMFGLLSLLLPKQYSAESQLYVMTDGRGGMAEVVSIQSVKYLTKSLKYLITTSDFSKKVIDGPDANFDRERWIGLDERTQRYMWKRNVQPCLKEGTGIIRLKVYSENKADALVFSQAVTQTVIQRGFEYLGEGVVVKVVSESIVSKWPARPCYGCNIFLGFLIGGLLSLVWIIRRHSKRHFFFN